MSPSQSQTGTRRSPGAAQVPLDDAPTEPSAAELAEAIERVAPEGNTLYEQLSAPFDHTFKDRRGGQEFTYITMEQVASRLNLVLGPGGWSYSVLREGYNEQEDELWALGHLEAWIDGHWVIREQFGSAKLKRTTPPCIWTPADGPNAGEVCGDRPYKHDERHRDHRYMPSEERQPAVDLGNDMKAAATEALKKCASLYGVGLYLMARNAAGGSATVARQAGGARQQQQPRQPQQERQQQAPAPQPAATDQPATKDGPRAIICQSDECTARLERVEFDDGSTWEPYELANRGLKQFKRVLCWPHFEGRVFTAALEQQASGGAS